MLSVFSASEQGISNYATVFPNEMLLEMASQLPTTREELLLVQQCTEYKLNQFNADSRFLEVTLNYLSILGGKQVVLNIWHALKMYSLMCHD
ncbi:hypothetical protein AHF37_12779 [Paragonimus kellicotti]|nr:hypothetical protein AHF37_12779 [Paragonimus kellicotti]